MSRNRKSSGRIALLLTTCLYNSLLLVFMLVDISKWLGALLKQSAFYLLKKPLNGTEKRDWYWGQKFGLVSKHIPSFEPATNTKTILVHCASVGEVVAAVGLIKHILSISQTSAHSSNLHFVVSTNTKTGKEQLLRMLDESLKQKVTHTYLPVDLPWLMRSLLRQIKPDLLMIMEVELWPNLINQCHKLTRQNNQSPTPIFIVNARLTDKTKQGYQKFAALSQRMIKQLDRVFARNQTDFNNYADLSMPPQKLSLAGNIKFDIELADFVSAEKLRRALNLERRQVIIAGSTHQGEEALVIEAYKQFKTQYPELILIICPRHPERFETVHQLLIQEQLEVKKMSEAEVPDKQTDVLLGDQMGQLSKLYGVCDIAFVGGSFAKKGGHNPIEAAAFAKPIVMGPHIYNNPEICQTLADDGGLVVAANHFEFIQQLNSWLVDDELRVDVGKHGLQTLRDNAGVTEVISHQVLDKLAENN